MFERYAVYFTPPPGDLAEFGARWLGWDSATGRAIAAPSWPALDVGKVTNAPRKYGFHATLKAPFHLTAGTDLAGLALAVEGLATRLSPVAIGALELRHDHGFVALRPKHQPASLTTTVGEIMRDLDGFRAPLSATDMARRRASGLTSRQDQQLCDWGYPFVFDDFQFHLTLSGTLDPDDAVALIDALKPQVAPLIREPLWLDAITLMGQGADGMFHQIHRYPLSHVFAARRATTLGSDQKLGGVQALTITQGSGPT